MFSTIDIYLSRTDEPSRVTCPKCESSLVEETGNYNYTCLDCLAEFTVNPMADDDTIPF